MASSLINDAGDADICLRKTETRSRSPTMPKSQFKNESKDFGVKPETLELQEKSTVGTCA